MHRSAHMFNNRHKSRRLPELDPSAKRQRRLDWNVRLFRRPITQITRRDP